MEFKNYLDKFQQAADLLDKKLLGKKQLEAAVGIYQDSVFLKLYKKSWTSDVQSPLTAESRIFFSVWINDVAIQQQKIWYNLHAFKLRQLKGYAIESRKFAECFRANFGAVANQWQNVSVKFGPQTLMQGWVNAEPKNIEKEILELANHFLKMDQLVDNQLAAFKKVHG